MNSYELAEMIIGTCTKRFLTVSVAESLTGGMVAATLVDIPGCSEVLHEGIVAYSNAAKSQRLNVDNDTLVDFGAVSPQTAAQMAEGLLDNCDFAVSTTGIAGPGGGSEDKPVGLTYIGIASKFGTKVYKEVFQGDRTAIRIQATHKALQFLIDNILNTK